MSFLNLVFFHLFPSELYIFWNVFTWRFIENFIINYCNPLWWFDRGRVLCLFDLILPFDSFFISFLHFAVVFVGWNEKCPGWHLERTNFSNTQNHIWCQRKQTVNSWHKVEVHIIHLRHLGGLKCPPECVSLSRSISQ